MDLFDNDVLGVKTARIAPERIAKKSKKSISFWPMFWALVFFIVLFCVCYFVTAIRTPLADFTAGAYTRLVTDEWPETPEDKEATAKAASATACVDSDMDHKCNDCDAVLTECIDKDRDLCCDYIGCQKPIYEESDAFWMIFLPILLLCILVEVLIWYIIYVKKNRLYNRISIEFYKDVIIYRDGKDIIVRSFVGTYFASMRFESFRQKRHNYGTVIVDCPGGPAAGMIFSRIDNPGALVSYLNAKRVKESVSYHASSDPRS